MRRGVVTITGRYEVAGHQAIIGGGHVVLGVTMGGGGPGHWGRHRGVVSRADQGHRAGHGRGRRGRVHPWRVIAPGSWHLGAPAGPGGAVLAHQRHEVREVVLAPGGAVLVTILGASAGAGVVVRVRVVQVLGRQTWKGINISFDISLFSNSSAVCGSCRYNVQCKI